MKPTRLIGLPPNRALAQHIDRAKIKPDYYIIAALAATVVIAVIIRLPGLHWLIGYGYLKDYSFHPDDYRFVVSASDFNNPALKPGGYPLFMVTQLFIVNHFLHILCVKNFNSAVVLRSISLTYAILGIIFFYFFTAALGFSRFTAVLSSFFLACSPLHITVSDFGTADVSVLLFFYMTVFAAWKYQSNKKMSWFYTAIALSGITMADKFFLPALIPVVIIVLSQPYRKLCESAFVSLCVLVTFFCGSSFFNYTPWDFNNLLQALAFDNVEIIGGYSPIQQIVRYAWDLIPCSGVITFGLAMLGAAFLLWRFDYARFRKVGLERDLIWEAFLRGLQAPALVIVLPLLVLFALIVVAQVHGSRHILVFVPGICLLAAIGVSNLCEQWEHVALPVKTIGVASFVGVLALQLADGLEIERLYSDDIRAKVGDFLAEQKPPLVASTFSGYTHFKGVSIIDTIPLTPIFVTCDIEYHRYFLAAEGKPVFHVFGGRPRMRFFVSLLAGKTTYVSVFDTKRPHLSLEDYLVEKGWIPQMDTFVPNECIIFRKTGT